MVLYPVVVILHPDDSIGFLLVTVTVLNVADPFDDSTDLFDAMCRITTLFVLDSHTMKMSLLESRMKLEQLILGISSDCTQFLYTILARTSIFEFSLFRLGLDICGIIIPKKLFRRILRWKK